MSEQEENKVLWTIDGVEYSPEDLTNQSQIHFIRAQELRNQLANLQAQAANLAHNIEEVNAVIFYRENLLRESMKVVEEPEAEVVN